MSVSVRIEAGDVQAAIDARLEAWAEADFAARLWNRDATLWFDPPRDEIVNRLGWLCSGCDKSQDSIGDLVDSIRTEGITDVVLLGMGGSSLAPEVFAAVFGDAEGPALTVLDSTHPDSVRAVDAAVEPETTLFIVASKSGTTLETMSFFRFFWERVSGVIDDPGSRFIAITDPESDLARLGAERGFREVFLAPPDVGGRFSALVDFGLIPAALVGVDLERLLAGADAAAWACGPDVPVAENPALRLGAALGEFALAGRDTIVFAPEAPFDTFPDWIEQLIAESLGKDGKGILPVADGVAPPAPDRLPFTISMGNVLPDGEPSVAMGLGDAYDLGGAMFILEMATAAAGAVLGVHPFDQPDVQLAKSLARKAMTDGLDGIDISEWTIGEPTTGTHVESLLSQVEPDGYVAIQAYLEHTAMTAQRLHAIAGTIADATGAAVTIGYGPRFLHSTGQFHKGGPEGGVFLQIVDHPSEDLAIPETDYTFGALIAAQSFGDQAALRDRGRPVGMVCLGDAGQTALPRLRELIRLSLR